MSDRHPFCCCFFLDFSFQSKLMSGRLFAAPKQHQVQPVTWQTARAGSVSRSGQAVPTAPWHAGRWRQTAAPPGRMRCVRAARGAHVARERLREVQGRWALQLPRRSRNNN